MSERGLNLATLRAELSIAEGKEKTARANIILQDNNAARKQLADATAEVERLKREVKAAEEAGS